MSKSRRKDLGQPSDELLPDDGIDPRTLFRRETRTRNQARKDGQLCKHAFRVFSLIFDELAAQDWASGVFLATVSPAPDASRLRLGIAFADPRTLDDAERVLCRLRELSSHLRWELAGTLSRRRVPELVFGLAESEGADG